MVEEFRNALYKGRLPERMKVLSTVLIPKDSCPQQWGSARPITLSTSLLKMQSQLFCKIDVATAFDSVAAKKVGVEGRKP